MSTKRILGIDPGTGRCGFGLIQVAKGRPAQLVSAGVISTPAHTPLADRLLDIYDSMHEIIRDFRPDIMSIEKLFFNQNITTGITVAEARGVCLLAAKQQQLAIFEYTPLQIKKAMTGYGRATKTQMQEMVRNYLRLQKIIKPDDAADALAAAITHALMAKIDY